MWERVLARGVLAAIVLLMVGAGLSTWYSRGDDEVVDPDVVVVLGGGGGERVAAGRALAEQHQVPLVLSAEAILHGWVVGLECEPPVFCELPEPHTTHGEARMVAALAAEHGWQRVVVATSRYHVGRTRLLMRQCLDEVAVVGASRQVWVGRHLFSAVREAVATVAAVSVRRAC